MKKNVLMQPQITQNNYSEILQRRSDELRHFLDRSRDQVPSPQDIDELHMRVYNLMGSGAIYGHLAVSDAASRLEAMLNSSGIAWGAQELTSAFENLIQTCRQAAEMDQDNQIPNIPRIAIANASSSRPVLLVIDDDPAIHDIVAALFGDEAEIFSAYNSKEAIEAVYRCEPDLILLDHYMPGVSGLALLERFRGDDHMPSVPIMMLTAENQAHVKSRVMEAGVIDYITKPFDVKNFADKVGGFLNRFHMTVLVASENLAERKQLSKKLRQQGVDVMEAGDGASTLKLAHAHVPELIILDECMLGADRNRFLRHLREDDHTRAIPVLYLTVNEQESRKVPKDFRPGLIDHVVTPFIPADIVAHGMAILDSGVASQPELI